MYLIEQKNSGRLHVRVYAAVPLATCTRLDKFVQENGYGDQWLHWGNLKGFTDGSLGSHTAFMFEPYSDNGENDTDVGFLITPEQDLYNWTKFGDSANLQVSLHAIGDKANSIVLNIFKNITTTTPPKDRRFRIEHAQHVRFQDIPMFSSNSIIASMQPYHLADDGRWAERIIGPERIKYTYPFHSMLQNNTVLAFGSDWEVAPGIPLLGIYAAVTRTTTDGKNPGGWVPEQKITLEQTLKAYTSGSAFSEFSENEKGLLKNDYLADLVIIDKDLFNIPPSDLWNTSVLLTMVDGQIKYQSSNF